MDIGNLISGSSALSKSSLNIWKFSVHVLLKTSLENFEHYFAGMWDECNCVIVWKFSFPSPGNVPDSEIKPRSPALQADSLPSEPWGKPKFLTIENSSWAISNPKRWCSESDALNMPANLDNSAVAKGLEKVSFQSNPKESLCQRMFKLPHNCTHLTH